MKNVKGLTAEQLEAVLAILAKKEDEKRKKALVEKKAAAPKAPKKAKEIPSENPEGHEPSKGRKEPKIDKRKTPEFIEHLRKLAKKRKDDAAKKRAAEKKKAAKKATAKATKKAA